MESSNETPQGNQERRKWRDLVERFGYPGTFEDYLLANAESLADLALLERGPIQSASPAAIR